MQTIYFTERPYRGLTEEEVYRNGTFFAISNARLDTDRAAADYNYYFDEFVYAEELGFDGLGLNEHHGNPFCMGGVVDVEAAVLARITSKAKIVLIGNALPNRNPLRLAEELAIIDLISRGRLVTGWVRGAGFNQFFNNLNPAYNREYFEEAHDFIIQAWTRPGPWRYEGKHFHYRHVNPWALPYQKPHPQMWIPGVLSPETIIWAARHAYPFMSLGATPSMTCDMWDIYADEAARQGYQAGPENFGCLIQIAVADTDDRAQEIGKSYYFGGGHPALADPAHQLPPGYNSPDAIRRLSTARGEWSRSSSKPSPGGPRGTWRSVNRDRLEPGGQETSVSPEALDSLRHRAMESYAEAQSNLKLIVGTPDTVTQKLKTFLDVIRPGCLFFSAPQGDTSNEDRLRSLQLLGEEVLPEVKAHAKSIGLVDSFERLPGSVKLRPGEDRSSVVDRDLLRSLSLQ